MSNDWDNIDNVGEISDLRLYLYITTVFGRLYTKAAARQSPNSIKKTKK